MAKYTQEVQLDPGSQVAAGLIKLVNDETARQQPSQLTHASFEIENGLITMYLDLDGPTPEEKPKEAATNPNTTPSTTENTVRNTQPAPGKDVTENLKAKK